MRRIGLLFGPLSALILVAAITVLPVLVPQYDPVRQTVSEIGEVGSPAHGVFTAALLSAAACLLIFAWAMRRELREAGRATLPAWLTGLAAVSVAGVGWFSFPHPWHSRFGLSEIVGYQAPLVLALVWRRAPDAGRLATFSGIMAVLLWLAIVANLSALDFHGRLFALERPVYGLVQRTLFGVWIVWSAGAGILLYRRAGRGAGLGALAPVGVRG